MITNLERRALPPTLQAAVHDLAQGGSRDAIVAFEGSRTRLISFRDLAAEVEREARLAQAGVGPGDAVILCGPGGADWIIACLAILHCGACVVPVDATLGTECFRHVLPLAQDDAPDDSREVTVARVGPEDRAILFYTSRTTGPPEGVPLTPGNLIYQLRVLAGTGIVSPDDRVLLPLPMHHVYPLVIGVPRLFDVLVGALAERMRRADAVRPAAPPAWTHPAHRRLRRRRAAARDRLGDGGARLEGGERLRAHRDLAHAHHPPAGRDALRDRRRRDPGDRAADRGRGGAQRRGRGPGPRSGRVRRLSCAGAEDGKGLHRGWLVPRRRSRPDRRDGLAPPHRAALEHDTAQPVLRMLGERFADRRIGPDSDLQLDLGIDSIGWLDLSLDIADQAGVTLSDATIGEIRAVRDLLVRVAEGGDAGADARLPLEEPERVLGEDGLRWLEPRGTGQRTAGRVLAAANRLVFRRLFGVSVRGVEALPANGPFVLVPNHASYLDPFAIAAALDAARLERMRWAVWSQFVATGPLRHAFARIAGILPVDDGRATAASIAFGSAARQRGHALAWFPKGIRSPDGQLQPFKDGIGVLLAHRNDIPVVAVVLRGTFEAWPRSRRLSRFRRLSVGFLAPCTPAELAAEGVGEAEARRIVNAIRTRIAAALRAQDAG